MESDQKGLIQATMEVTSPKTPRPAAQPKGTKEGGKWPGNKAHDPNITENAGYEDQDGDSSDNARCQHAMDFKSQMDARNQTTINIVTAIVEERGKLAAERERKLEAMLAAELEEMNKAHSLLRVELDDLRTQVDELQSQAISRQKQVDSLETRVGIVESGVQNLKTEMDELSGQNPRIHRWVQQWWNAYYAAY